MSDCDNEIICCEGEDGQPLSVFDYSLVAYPVYYNSEISVFVPCPEGFTCTAPGVTIVIPPGTISYRPPNSNSNNPTTVNENINNQANEQANNQAQPILNPQRLPPNVGLRVFRNTVQSYTANCQSPLVGPAVTRTIPPGAFEGVGSQAAADAAALQAATDQANAALVCYQFTNTEQTASCPSGYTGGSVTIPAGTYFSNASQAAADNLAMAAAEAQLSCVATCPQAKIEALTWTISANGTGSGSGINGTLSHDRSAASPDTATLTSSNIVNNCGADFTVRVTVNYTLKTLNSWLTSSYILKNGVQVNGFGYSNPSGVCTTTNGSYVADVSIPNGQTVAITLRTYQQVAQACTPQSMTAVLSIL